MWGCWDLKAQAISEPLMVLERGSLKDATSLGLSNWELQRQLGKATRAGTEPVGDWHSTVGERAFHGWACLLFPDATMSVIGGQGGLANALFRCQGCRIVPAKPLPPTPTWPLLKPVNQSHPRPPALALGSREGVCGSIDKGQTSQIRHIPGKTVG